MISAKLKASRDSVCTMFLLTLTNLAGFLDALYEVLLQVADFNRDIEKKWTHKMEYYLKENYKNMIAADDDAKAEFVHHGMLFGWDKATSAFLQARITVAN